MARTLKNLGIAFALMTAVLAVAGASAATAQQTHKFRTTAGQEAFLTAEALGPYTIKATPEDDSEITCNKYTTNSSIKDGAQEVTIVPSFGECSFRMGETKGTAFIDTTGCDFRGSAVTTEGNPTGGAHASAQIQCPVGAAHLDTKVTALKLMCRTVPPQEISDGLRFVNSETEGGLKDIIVESTIHNGVSTTPDTAACPTESGEPEVHEAGTVVGSIRVRGFKDVAKTEPTSIWFE
jgi:hypothetical protein